MQKLWLLAFLLVGAALAEPKLQRHVGSSTTCFQGQKYRMDYDVDGLREDQFINLDQVVGLAHRELFQSSLVSYERFVTSWGAFSDCTPSNELLLHRIISNSVLASRQLELVAVQARYDEVMKDANVTLAHVGSCGNDEPICIGANVGPDCTHALKQIPVYSNPYVSITCQNCFVGAHAEVFFKMQITLWKLTSVAAGLRKMAIDAAVVLDMQSHASWSAAIDKTMDLVKQVVVLKFNIGPIPVRIWFEIPVQVKASASFSENAHAQAGATARYDIGEWSISWTPQSHWVPVKPTPKFSWAPVLSGSADFRGHVDFAVIPTFKLHVDSLLNFDLTLAPTLHLDIKGGALPAQACADLSYDATLVSRSDLTIDIPWLFVHVDKEFGPYTIMDTGVQPIGKKCIP